MAHWKRGGSMKERWFNRGKVAPLRRGGPMVVHPVVLGSNPAAPQLMANSVRLQVGCQRGWNSTVCSPVSGSIGRGNAQKTINIQGKKFNSPKYSSSKLIPILAKYA